MEWVGVTKQRNEMLSAWREIKKYYRQPPVIYKVFRICEYSGRLVSFVDNALTTKSYKCRGIELTKYNLPMLLFDSVCNMVNFARSNLLPRTILGGMYQFRKCIPTSEVFTVPFVLRITPRCGEYDIYKFWNIVTSDNLYFDDYLAPFVMRAPSGTLGCRSFRIGDELKDSRRIKYGIV